jgi:hypothetical protein
MSEGAVNKYKVYRDAENIRLKEIAWESEETSRPSLKVRVLIDGRTIENVTFERDITSKAYAMPPATNADRSSGITILFGGDVQEILDSFADFILPKMKPLGLNPLTGEKVLDPDDRTNSSEIENTKQKINGHLFLWEK